MSGNGHALTYQHKLDGIRSGVKRQIMIINYIMEGY